MRIPMPAQTGPEADRLRYVGAATRRIARGVDLDEILLGPVPLGGAGLRRRDPGLPARAAAGRRRAPLGPAAAAAAPRRRRPEGPSEADDDAPVGATPLLPALLPTMEPSYGGTGDSIGVLLDGPLAEVLRGVRPVFADSIRAADALAELLGRPATTRSACPPGRRALLAPLRGRRRVIGAAVLLRRADRAAVRVRRPAGRRPARHAHRARRRQGGAVRPRGLHRGRPAARDAARLAARSPPASSWPAATCPPRSPPGSAATGTTRSRCPAAGWRWSSATSWATP